MAGYISFSAVLILCLICWTLPRWQFLQGSNHPPILSVSAGVGISYVFLALLPKLAEIQTSIFVKGDDSALLPVGLHAYLAALVGFVIFLLLVRKDLAEDEDTKGRRPSSTVILVTSIFALYNAQIGFLLGAWPIPYWLSYLGLTFAFGMHFIGINYHLWRHYPNRYTRYFRVVFSLSMLAGWLGSLLAEQLNPAFKFSTMFVAGGIIITAIREEIPPREEANIPYFLVAVIAASLFIIFTKILLARGQ
ncbi:hypothetical protein [Microbulbifer sediminum]|uniref:hypothetical protein n=1 Tax=Microbulbifer sediminum TaxID=2904250 RepID=UPI001F1A0A2B|nr:hypothetical protein [Microbulbifer sediminum]